MRTYLALFFLSCLASLALTPAVIGLCRRFGWVDAPGGRKVHDQPVPRLGGAAVVAAFLATLLALFFYDNAVTRLFQDIAPRVGRILLPALAVAVLGVVDDLRGVRARTKFLVQVAAAASLYALGFRIATVNLPWGAHLDLGLAGGLLLTVFWIVAVTNAFNFIDGMDGLAAGIALFTALSVLVMSAVTGAKEVLVLAVPLAGALAGFLPFNWHPARVFLGDGGSYFLGFVLGALAIMSSTKASTLVSVAVPIALLGIPLLDTSLAVARRFLRGQPLFDADGDHIHHRLLRAGHRHRAAVLMLYGLTVALAGLAMLGMLAGPHRLALVIPLGIGLLAALVVRRLGYEEFDELWDMFRKAARFQRHVIANQVRLRRFVQEIGAAADPAALFRLLEQFLAEAGFDSCHLEIWPADPSFTTKAQSTQRNQEDRSGSNPQSAIRNPQLESFTTEAQRTQSNSQSEHRTSNTEHRTSNSDPSPESPASSPDDSTPHSAIRNPQSEFGTQELRPDGSDPSPEPPASSPDDSTPHSAFRTPHSAHSPIHPFTHSPLDWHWSSPSGANGNGADTWRLRVPMRDRDGVHRGYAYLERRLERERVLFQVASLLDTFGVHFPSKLYSFDPAELAEYLEGLEDSQIED